jgi:hypothetical protein
MRVGVKTSRVPAMSFFKAVGSRRVQKQCYAQIPPYRYQIGHKGVNHGELFAGIAFSAVESITFPGPENPETGKARGTLSPRYELSILHNDVDNCRPGVFLHIPYGVS